MNAVHVEGKDAGKIIVYALSTCGWCRKTKEFLRELGVKYDYIDTDLLVGEEKEEIVKQITNWNPRCSFPTLVINDQHCIVGFDKERIKETLKL